MNFTLGEVSRLDSWPHGVVVAQWRGHEVPSNTFYNSQWERIAGGLHLDTGQSSWEKNCCYFLR